MNNPISINQKFATLGFRIGHLDSKRRVPSEKWLEIFDLEKTLILACREAGNDYRILSILMSWISVHADRVILDKFKKLAKQENQIRHNPVLNAVAVQATVSGYIQWKKLISRQREDCYVIDPESTKRHEQLGGLLENWKEYKVYVPKKLIRIRLQDVLTPQELIQKNLQYKNRVVYGSSWRADIITAVEMGITKPMAISKLLGCSYEPAYRVSKDYLMVQTPKVA